MFRSLVVVVKFVKVLNFSTKRRLKFVCACGTTMGQTERGLAIRQVKLNMCVLYRCSLDNAGRVSYRNNRLPDRCLHFYALLQVIRKELLFCSLYMQ